MPISQVSKQEGILAKLLYSWCYTTIRNNQLTVPKTHTVIMHSTLFTTTYLGLNVIFKPWIM